MKKVALVGTVTPRGLGDALQCYVTMAQLQKLLSETEVTFFCPDLRNGVSFLSGLDLKAQLFDLDPIGNDFLPFQLLLRSFLHKRRGAGRKTLGTTNQTKAVSTYLKKIKSILENAKILQNYSVSINRSIDYLTPYTIDKYSNSLIMKSFSFDASIFGGHTICVGIYPFIHKYEAFHSVTEGPVLTAPISISALALRQYRDQTSVYKNLRMIKRLTQSLRKFDLIYVRGPYSLGILRDHLNIDEEKIGMCLDAGFGTKFIFPEIIPMTLQKRKKLRLLIVPRKGYFYLHKMKDKYELYLRSLSRFILWASHDFDAQIYLASQTISEDELGSEAAVKDLCDVLRKYNGGILPDLRIIKLESLIDACSWFSAMDVVISSYMHGGVIPLSLGIPAFFILPYMDTKVLDNLSFLGLDVKSFSLDMFNLGSLKSEILINKIGDLLERNSYYKKKIELAVDKALPSIEAPVKTLMDLLR